MRSKFENSESEDVIDESGIVDFLVTGVFKFLAHIYTEKSGKKAIFK